MGFNVSNMVKIALGLGFIAAIPLLLSWTFPRFKWIFFLVVAIEIYALVDRILRGRALTIIISGFLIYVFYELFIVAAPILMLYWVIGSLGFGMIGSIIVFGMGGR